MTPPLLPSFILSGGQSKRFGSDKARAQLDNSPLILHVAQLLTPYTSHLTVLSNQPDKYQDLGLHTIADILPQQGPMGGLQTALSQLQDDTWFLLVSCDVAGLRAEWIELLLSHAAAPYDAIAFFPQRWEPLFALYHTSIHPTVERHLQSGQRAMWRLLEDLNSLALPIPKGWEDLTQINSPQDLHRHKDKQTHS